MVAIASLTLHQLCLRYEAVTAVDRLSLHVEGGEILGLLGANGSGKSSTLNAIAGILDPASGEIRINSISRTEQPNDYAKLVGLVPQEFSLYEELSAWDNLQFFGRLYGLSGRNLTRRVEEVLEQVRLQDRSRCRLETLSGGMKRRVNLACAMIHDPVVLLLDEPTVALDPPSKECLFETLDNLRDEGRVIVLTTHDLPEAEQLCDRVAMLREGKLIASGRLSEFQVAEKSTLIGLLRESIAEQVEHAVRNRLSSDVEFRVIGRRIRLRAPDGEKLGMALASLYAEGVLLDSFRTPTAQLESFFCEEETPTHDAALVSGGSAWFDN